jgi:hypothetical protein
VAVDVTVDVAAEDAIGTAEDVIGIVVCLDIFF